MKLYVSKAEDRDQVIVILARNGYTVRQGKEKDPKNNKTVIFVESCKQKSIEKTKKVPQSLRDRKRA